MLRVHLADLRDSWTAWLGVAIVFATVNAALTIVCTIGYTGFTRFARHELTLTQSSATTIMQVLFLVMVCCVAMPVMGSATSLVVEARRGALARLGLAGATPRQVRTLVGIQLVAVCLACAVLGDLVGLALVRPFMALMDLNSQGEDMVVHVDPIYSATPVLVANLLCIVAALLGGRRAAKAASALPPVEALRQSQAPTGTRRLGFRGWAKLALLGLLVAATWAAVPVLLQNRNKETLSNIMVLGMLQIFLWGTLLAVAGPLLVAPVTRAWTGLVHISSPSWILARATTRARVDRLQKSMTPVMFCVGIAVGEVAAGRTMVNAIAATPMGQGITTPSLSTFLMVFGLPLAISFAGGVGSLLMMSRQRDAELALVGIGGATPAQRTVIPALEGVIITVSAVLLSLLMIVPTLAFQGWSFTRAGLAFRPVVPWGALVVVVLACAAVTVASSVLPTLRAQRQGENRVIARLVAE